MKGIKLLWLLLVMTPLCFAAKPEHEAVLKQLHLPYGFKISIFADNLPNARQMALGERGVLFVGTREGNVYAVQDQDNDGFAEQHYTLARDLYLPNGVAYKSGALYVAEVNRIIRFDEIEAHLDNPPAPVVVFDKLPSDKHHGWKYLRFGPDGKLYSAVGAPCNICNPEQQIYASLFRINPDGSGFQILAQGVRNSVGFDWEPHTHHLFFNENGRDYLGEDVPPDELNQWTGDNEHYGFPYCHAGTIPDPDHAGDKKCGQFKGPVWRYKAHIAPLGMRFYTGSQFPEHYYKQLFVAQHGSWNRSAPQGYQVALIKFSAGHPFSEQPFVSGWLTPAGEVLGRPVDILQLPNGSLLISDDKLGVIYKVEYTQ
ncbi:PQQ-dependent sugar dehydrogenase [Methylomonas sp. LL1]|uniref:PQQ-dependent sugar dehydrogenase n=1 Tax=Methylomonas sp. LL1 TaxID=2785785 RepID=UPI0018C39E59|nr:PQQ-dependent sugar dehydrogenase [Methylomonas sp. LL1]QPK63706.1 PQQ-dependent sugar dehydrogenase [Methylomonas sp. LL1]